MALCAARAQFTKFESTLDFAADGIAAGPQIPARIAALASSTRGTLLSPLLGKLRSALMARLRGSSLKGSLIARLDGGAVSVTVPQAEMRGRGGGIIASLSRLQYTGSGPGTGRTLPQIAGNFRIIGDGLPQLTGRMEQGARDTVFRLKMQPYRAATSSLAIPELLVTQTRTGAVRFDGTAIASGFLPGGRVRALRLPLSGTYTADGGLDLWRRCTTIRYESLVYSNLELIDRAIIICPARGRPVLRYAGGALSIAAGLPSLDVAGRLAGTPIAITSGPIGFAYPGVATARQLTVTLGPPARANRFTISGLTARFGQIIGGTFEGADVGIAAVPLDLTETQGNWTYAGGVLRLSDVGFILSDRQDADRFVPMPVTGGELALRNNIITASATILAPTDRRQIAEVRLMHDLSKGVGHSDLAVPDLLFDNGLQPADLTQSLRGVVANVKGRVTGTGRIDWNAAGVTSTGEFSSESLDLAAAFGPVTGASGTVRFTDLLGLTTAPDQTIRVATVNPGIEVKDGTIRYSLRGGRLLAVSGGSWPFMGGMLRLQPVALNLGESEIRRYVLEVEGLDAAVFVDSLDLGNIAATGIFDGALPLVFDEVGFGTIEGGKLLSRPPGGNVSYIGELTYEDLTPIANYAFQTLRSLDYRSMAVSVDGPITGDILTRVRFDGVTQGEGAKTNFITRQIAKLPIRFNVNIRAPFYKLMGNLKSIYDPAAVRDPRELGLLDDDGTRFVVPAEPDPPSVPARPPRTPAARLPDARPPDDVSSAPPIVQTPDSEDLP